jgi:hypothetical protein
VPVRYVANLAKALQEIVCGGGLNITIQQQATGNNLRLGCVAGVPCAHIKEANDLLCIRFGKARR